ncbi:HNH endonuclease [Clostridium beijerinckii]|uniref:HNH endonuclease n=1 Tax=Clostridium beijerinckii TaxID=1520 RepID=UPI00241517CD|nr:HNH endonuclease signature motif containing protein [Clostridium beijerinckii]
MCDISMKELLIASHIKEYSKCEKNAAEHLDLKNGLLLCANHDKLFDKHLISFNMDGTIKISDRVPKSQYEILRIDNCDNISIESFDEKYMSYHRNILNENNIG